jgi:hypothetical protein
VAWIQWRVAAAMAAPPVHVILGVVWQLNVEALAEDEGTST